MMTAFATALVALLILIVAGLLVRRNQQYRARSAEAVANEPLCWWEESGLVLGERIFDPADCRWLRDEIGHRDLERVLARERRRAALQWLKAIKSSFDDLVLLPASAYANTQAALPDWKMFWLTFRFHALVGSAILAVRLFGPYHRLIPPLNWLASMRRAEARRPRYHTVQSA